MKPINKTDPLMEENIIKHLEAEHSELLENETERAERLENENVREI